VIKEAMMMQEDIKNKYMNKDLISDSFADSINRNLVKYNIRLLLVAIILFSVFSVFNLLEWFDHFQNADQVPDTALNFYQYRMRPFIVLITILLGVYQWNYAIKGQRLILRFLDEQDVALFNAGYSFFNKASILSVIGYSIITISILVRYFFKYS
jgi:hypothetical protein